MEAEDDDFDSNESTAGSESSSEDDHWKGINFFV